jgi:hypothetical protein
VVPGGQALIWEHIEDAPGQPCPNPRFIIPRSNIDNIMDGPVGVHVRSFGVRCPATHEGSQLYGIIGMLHLFFRYGFCNSQTTRSQDLLIVSSR